MFRAPTGPIALILTGLLLVAAAYGTALIGIGATAGTDGVPITGTTYPIVPLALALGASLVLTGMLALAAARPGGTPRTLRVTVRLVFVATFGGLAYALAAPAPAVDGPLLFGLPRTTAIMVLVTGLIPLVVLPLAYARAFERDVLGDADLERVRAIAADDASRTPPSGSEQAPHA